MKILIFGASGATGQELVKQALLKDHTVTAFARTPSKINITHDRLQIIQGDVKDYVAVVKAINGNDAVISALGVSTPLKKDPVVIEGIRNIVHGMETLNVRRLIYLSFLAVGQGRNDAGFLIKYVISRIVRNEIEDHREKEALIKASGLAWTIVHPPKLTDGLREGKYRVGEFIRTTSFLATLSRSDLSDFMIREVTDNLYIQKTVRILN